MKPRLPSYCCIWFHHIWLMKPETVIECGRHANSELPCTKRGGCETTGRVWEWLLSITTTEFTVSLSAWFSCTHSSAMWMHLTISLVEPSLNVGSTKFKAVPAFQFIHACIEINVIQTYSKLHLRHFFLMINNNLVFFSLKNCIFSV